MLRKSEARLRNSAMVNSKYGIGANSLDHCLFCGEAFRQTITGPGRLFSYCEEHRTSKYRNAVQRRKARVDNGDGTMYNAYDIEKGL